MALAAYRYRILVTNTGPSVTTGVNVFNVGNDTALPDANVTNLLTAIKALYSSLTTYVPGSFSIGSRVLEYHVGTAAPRIVPVAAQAQTNAISAVLPPQLAAVLSWRTATGGRSYRGRTYLGPLNGAAVANQTLVGAFTGAANTAAATLITACKAQVTAPWGLIVHSETAATDTPVLTGNMDSRVDTLRSRS
jgi:hypothetical protein